MSGAYNYFPETFGGEGGLPSELIANDLARADGTAFTNDADSASYAEHLAVSRAIAYLHGLTRKVANVRNPARAVETLPRLERLYGTRPLPGASDEERRALVLERIAIEGVYPVLALIEEIVSSALGEAFIEMRYRGSADAASSIPGGAVVPGGATLGDGDWRSSIAAFEALATQGGLTFAEYMKRIGEAKRRLDDVIPAWSTFAVVEEYPGPGLGFYLGPEGIGSRLGIGAL